MENEEPKEIDRIPVVKIYWLKNGGISIINLVPKINFSQASILMIIGALEKAKYELLTISKATLETNLSNEDAIS